MMTTHLVRSSWPILILWLLAAASIHAQNAPRKQIELTYGPLLTPFTVTLVSPDGVGSGSRCPVVLALPPGVGNQDVVNAVLDRYWEREARARGYYVVSPTLHGVKLGTDPEKPLQALFQWMDKNLHYDTNRVILTGVSNGGLGAMRVAIFAPERFAAVLVLPGGYHGYVESFQKLRGKPVWLIVGEQDTKWKALAERNHRDLLAVGARAELTVVPGQGHGIAMDPKQLFDWMERNTNQPTTK